MNTWRGLVCTCSASLGVITYTYTSKGQSRKGAAGTEVGGAYTPQPESPSASCEHMIVPTRRIDGASLFPLPFSHIWFLLNLIISSSLVCASSSCSGHCATCRAPRSLIGSPCPKMYLRPLSRGWCTGRALLRAVLPARGARGDRLADRHEPQQVNTCTRSRASRHSCRQSQGLAAHSLDPAQWQTTAPLPLPEPTSQHHSRW